MTSNRIQLRIDDIKITTAKRALRKRHADYMLNRLKMYYNLQKKNRIIEYVKHKKSISL